METTYDYPYIEKVLKNLPNIVNTLCNEQKNSKGKLYESSLEELVFMVKTIRELLSQKCIDYRRDSY